MRCFRLFKKRSRNASIIRELSHRAGRIGAAWECEAYACCVVFECFLVDMHGCEHHAFCWFEEDIGHLSYREVS